MTTDHAATTDQAVSADRSAAPPADPMAAARAVADAVLYEGYLLYPYRASAAKNRLRWQFGVLAPPGYAAAGTGEHAGLRTECLVTPESGALLHARVRFLQLVTAAGDGDPGWDRAVPREVDAVVPVPRLLGSGWLTPFTVPGGQSTDPDSGVDERWQELRGELALRAEPVPGPHGLLRLRVEVTNTSGWPEPGDGEASAREPALRRSLVATHVLLAVTVGEFHSLLDPPRFARAAAEQCCHRGAWPVLVGDPRRRDAVLAAPIILYDFPQVAPESPGDLFDSTEIDELLSLRTLTLTDDEKQQARATDPRAAQLLDRVEAMPPEVLARLHGTIRQVRPAGGTTAGGTTVGATTVGEPAGEDTAGPGVDPRRVEVDGRPVTRGTRVRLAPRGVGGAPGGPRTDAQDMFLAGRLATVQDVLHDVDGGSYLAVTLDDDPGADLHLAHGRFRYFGPDEVRPLPPGTARADAGRPGAAPPARAGEPAGTVLVAGVGNLFLGDDGFGAALARRLGREQLPAGVRVADYGTSGVHLAFDLLGGYHATILLDAVCRGDPPGTVTVTEVDDSGAVAPADAASAVDAHGMQPDRALGLLRTLGGDPGRVLVVGCEPADTGHRVGLSEPVAAAVERAVPLVKEVVAAQLATAAPGTADAGEEGS